MSGPSTAPLVRRLTPKTNEYLCPGMYNIGYYKNQDHPALQRRIAKTGFGGLALNTQRFKDNTFQTPSVYAHAPRSPSPTRQNYQPFCHGPIPKKRLTNTIVPAPGTYNNIFKRKQIYQHSFGGPIRVKPAVQTICNPKNLSNCVKCFQQPIGDYWRNFTKEEDLCRKCMNENRNNVINKIRMRSVQRRKLMELEEYRVSKIVGQSLLNHFSLTFLCFYIQIFRWFVTVIFIMIIITQQLLFVY